MYYSGAMSMWPGLQSDAAHVRDLFCARTMRDKCVKTQLWISEKDVITTAHYDAAIRGFKRIDLWPIASGMGERRAKRHVSSALPIFLVKVTALSPVTISLAVWTESTQQLDRKQALDETPLPFEETWSSETMRCVALQFAKLVCDALDRRATFVFDLLTSRYAPSRSTSRGRNATSFCSSVNDNAYASTSSRCRLDAFDDTLREKQINRSGVVANRLMRLKPIGVREMYFWNWLESLALFLVHFGSATTPEDFLCEVMWLRRASNLEDEKGDMI
eukprot:g1646.t1